MMQICYGYACNKLKIQSRMDSFCNALPFQTARGAIPVFLSTHQRWFCTLHYPTWRHPEALFCLNKVEMLVKESQLEVEISVTDTLRGMVQSGLL